MSWFSDAFWRGFGSAFNLFPDTAERYRRPARQRTQWVRTGGGPVVDGLVNQAYAHADQLLDQADAQLQAAEHIANPSKATSHARKTPAPRRKKRKQGRRR